MKHGGRGIRSRSATMPGRVARIGLALGLACVLTGIYLNRHLAAGLGDMAITDLGFGFGPLIESIVERGVWETRSATCDLSLTAHRMPLVPLFGSGIWLLADDLLLLVAVKNVVQWTIVVLCLDALVARHRLRTPIVLAAVSVILAIPLMSTMLGQPFAEEGYVAAPLAMIVLGLVRADRAGLLLVSIGASLMLLTKASWYPFAFAAVALGLLGSWRSTGAATRLAALTVALAPYVAWGVLQAGVAGTALLSEASSYNGLNLYKGNNPEVERFYPSSNLDWLEREGVLIDKDRDKPCFGGEWEGHIYYRSAAIRHMVENPELTAQRFALRAWLAAGTLWDWSTGGARAFSVDLLVIRVLTVAAVALAALALLRRRRSARPTAALVLIGLPLLLAPSIVGFVYPRHLVVPGLLCLFCIVALATGEEPRRQR